MSSTTTDDGLGAPTPEEVGAAYDEFGWLFGVTLGDSAIQIGDWVPAGARRSAHTLQELADVAMDRSTDAHTDALSVRPGDRVLDIGCGTGGPAERLAVRTGARVTGITVSASQLDRCRERAAASPAADLLTFAYGDAMDLGYADGEFDAAWAIDSVPHFSDPLRGLREAWRVLRPGARLLMTDFTLRGEPPAEGLATFRRVWTAPPPLRSAQVLELIDGAGFELDRMENKTHNLVINGEVMAMTYRDRREEVLAHYGPEVTAGLDEAMPLLRRFVRDHLGYYVYLLRKP